MGKKSKILYWSCLVVNLICFILDCLPFPLSFSFFRFSFALSLITIGLLLFVRAVTLKLDSSMLISIILFFMGVLNAVSYFGQVYFNLDVNQLWPYYIFVVAFACLVTGLYFKHKLLLKLSVLFLGFGLFTLLFLQKIIIIGWYIAIMIAWFVAYFVINLILTKKGGRNG